MFVYYDCRHYARVLKEAKTLAEVGPWVGPAGLEGLNGAIRQGLADEHQYDTMRKNVPEAVMMFNWEREPGKLPDIYRRLSHRFDNRSA